MWGEVVCVRLPALPAEGGSGCCQHLPAGDPVLAGVSALRSPALAAAQDS